MSTMLGKDSVPPVYESHPPEWLPRVHQSSDLGYPGFHPPRPGQDEDVLCANVKSGFVLGHSIPAETFSAHDSIGTTFVNGKGLVDLEELMNLVFTRRADQNPAIPPSSFRMPSRVTPNDAKRQAWFADLANPDVPLHKLGKSVPHGAKGGDLLDLLQTNNVAIPRAVWFLRVFGANETAGLRNRPSYNPTQYSIEWANVVTGYLKKQLGDIALPSAPRAGLNIKQTFKGGVLADVNTRERWISRFTYCLKLLRTFYSEGLVDNRTFLLWLVQQLGSCNLAQAGFVTRLADEYLDGMLESRPLTRPFVDACLAKLSEIRTTSAQEFLTDTEILLKTLLQRVCLNLPDAFVNPRMWTAHSALVGEALTENITTFSADQHIELNSRDIQQTLADDLADIKRRNESMLFQNLPPRVLASLASAVSDIQLLNSISSNTNIDEVHFFDVASDTIDFVRKLDLLLTWSVTPLQYGDHRAFAAVTLLRIWRSKAGDRATRRDCTPPDELLQDRLFDWLDSSEVSGEVDNIRAVSLLFGKLVKHELFSYASYIQRLIARGEPGLSYAEEHGSRHRNFLRWIPLQKVTSSLISQRKVTLHGVRARETPEDLNEREIRKEIRGVLPELFGGEPQPVIISTSALLSHCTTLFSASRFEQVRTFRQWLLPILRKRITSQVPGNLSDTALLHSYSVSVELMVHAQCLGSVLDLSLLMLELPTTTDVLMIVIETFHRHLVIWASMNASGTITTALYCAHQLWRSRGVQSRALLALLVKLDDGRHLDAVSREHVAADISAFAHALQPEIDHPDPVPSVLPEILLLADDPNPEAPSILANSLWYKYRTSYDWGWKVWDNTVASLRQIPVMTSDMAGRHACALRYGTFLLQIDQHLPGGLDHSILQWFLGPGKSEVVALSTDAWDVLTVVLLYMCIHGALAMTTILRGLIYPAWQLAASASATGQPLISWEGFLCAANNLFELLLLREEGGAGGFPPRDLPDIQRMRTRRQDVYYEPHFSLLVASIPTLVIIEKNEHVSDELRGSAMSIRCALCETREFRQASHRNLDGVRDAFEQTLQSGSEGNLAEPMIDALRLVLSESDKHLSGAEICNWQDVSSLLSPWKLAATTIHLQFMLRQMGREISQDSTHDAASDSLDKLTLSLFHHSISSEEAYFVAEMASGVESSIASKFINNGLRCITMILNDSHVTPHPDVLGGYVQRAGELLRILVHVAEPLRDETSLLPELECGIQEQFFDAICAKFEDIRSMLGGNSVTEHDLPQVTRSAIFLGRLLQFDLGLRGVWTTKTREANSNLSSTLFQLAVLYGAGNHIDLVAYPLLVDTLYYLLDEIPPDTKTPTFDPYRNYPQIAFSELPSDMPLENRDQLRSLLPWTPPNAVVSNLSYAHRDSSGHLVHGAPVLNRPWEWIENLGEPAVLDPKEEEKEREEKERLKTKYLVKNSGSLSLDTFGARLTGDGVISKGEDGRIEGNIRSFEDGLSSESIFKRDWRETRIELDDMSLLSGGRTKGEAEECMPSSSNQGRNERRATSRVSPAASVRSRASANASGSLRQSPAQVSLNRLSTSTASEPIDIDSIPTTDSLTRNTSKRKLASVSDDDVEIIEGPIPAPPRTTKKTKPKVSTKPRGKKR